MTFIICNAKSDVVMFENIEIVKSPELRAPFFIGGFEGWGNALDVSKVIISYLIRKLGAQKFAKLYGELFYRFDESRPWVDIKEGELLSIDPPQGEFFEASIPDAAHDILLFRAQEPQLRWSTFVREVLELCRELKVKTIVTVGSMYDNVLHTDIVISGIASNQSLLNTLKEKNISPITYQGPGAIHSMFHSMGSEMGFECISLWCHCPYYLQGATHFGLVSALGNVLSSLCGFELDTTELELSWKELNQQIQSLIEKNPELSKLVEELRRAKVRGSWETVKSSIKKNGKVIHIEDFLRPK